MNESDPALDRATELIATLLATAYLRLQLAAQKPVDSSGDRERT